MVCSFLFLVLVVFASFHVFCGLSVSRVLRAFWAFCAFWFCCVWFVLFVVSVLFLAFSMFDLPRRGRGQLHTAPGALACVACWSMPLRGPSHHLPPKMCPKAVVGTQVCRTRMPRNPVPTPRGRRSCFFLSRLPPRRGPCCLGGRRLCRLLESAAKGPLTPFAPEDVPHSGRRHVGVPHREPPQRGAHTSGAGVAFLSK